MFPHTGSGRSPTGPAQMAPGPAQPPSLSRTFMTSTVRLPVVRFEVGWPGCLHQQVLDVPPGQLAAAMTQEETAALTSVSNADRQVRQRQGVGGGPHSCI